MKKDHLTNHQLVVVLIVRENVMHRRTLRILLNDPTLVPPPSIGTSSTLEIESTYLPYVSG